MSVKREDAQSKAAVSPVKTRQSPVGSGRKPPLQRVSPKAAIDLFASDPASEEKYPEPQGHSQNPQNYAEVAKGSAHLSMIFKHLTGRLPQTPWEGLARQAGKAKESNGTPSVFGMPEHNQQEQDTYSIASKKEIFQKWRNGSVLTKDEQNVVNKVTYKRPGMKRQSQTPVIPTSNPYSALQDSERKPKGDKRAKFAKKNLDKQVSIVRYHMDCDDYVPQAEEPEPKCGSVCPSQYQASFHLENDDHSVTFHEEHDVPIAPELGGARGNCPINNAALNLARIRLVSYPFSVPYDYRSWTSPVPFGPELERGPSPMEYLEERDEPGGGILGYRERRLIGVTWFNKYQFAYLDFIGWWNRSGFSRSASRIFADHWGLHFHENYVEVLIPADLVNEMKEWWNHRERDPESVNFGLSVSRCRVLTSELAITADQLRVATLYAPAIAYLESWEEQQNVSRVTFDEYTRSSLPMSWSKNKRSMSTFTGRVLACAGVGALALGAVGVYALGRRISGQLRGKNLLSVAVPAPRVVEGPLFSVVPPAPRLVGVELNPGDKYTPRDAGYKNFVARSILNAHCAVRPLVNCASLPHPKNPGVSKKGRLSLRDGNLRYPLNLKSPTECRGKHCQYGFDSRGYKPSAFASNQHNEKQALVARILCDTPEPDAEELLRCLNWCKRNYRKLFPHIHKVKSVSWEEYLRRSNSSPSVKRILQKTHERLVAEGKTEDSILSAEELYRFTKRSSFVKVENDLYDSPLGRKHKAPRLIQGGQPEFICLVGPWIMALQDAVKREWGKNNFLCFTSGVSAEEAAEFITGGSGPWLEDDLGKFDSSIRTPWCEFEVWLCKKFGAPRAVLDLMTANIKTHGTTHHGWRYKCEGTRKSGDPYTSVFNSIINGLSHLYLYCKWTGRSVESARNTIRMLLQGDDNCCRHLEKRHFPWQCGMASLGFDSEAIYRRHYFQVEFCSNRLYLTKQGYCFGPKPGRVLAKLGYTINPPVGVSPQSLMRGVALGLRRSCNFIAPLSATIEKIVTLTEGYQAWYKPKQFTAFDESQLKVKKFHEESVDCMLNLNVNYDWDYGKQSSFKEKLAHLKFGDELPLITDLLFDRDTGGPQSIFGGWSAQLYPAVC